MIRGLQPPPEQGNESLIGKNALWDLVELQNIINVDAIAWIAVTEKCRNDIKRLVQEPGGFDLTNHILLLKPSNYDKSLWCRSSPDGKQPGFWLPCDAYRLTVPFVHPVTGWEGPANYYFKIAKAFDGKLVLFVSVHTG